MSLRNAALPLFAFAATALAACMQSAPVSVGAQAADTGYHVYDGAPHEGPYVSAHRGGAAYAPEDTLAAYQNAARLGVDDFETDTSLTSDGVLVLIHDGTVNRTSNCTGNVSAFTLEDLRKCDAGYWYVPGQGTTSGTHNDTQSHPYRGKGVVFPTAQEVFDLAKSLGPLGPTVTIELKDYDCRAAAPALVDLIHASGIQHRIIVQSFEPYCLDLVKLGDSTIATLHLSNEGCTAPLAYNIARGHNYVSPTWVSQADGGDVNAECADAVHAAGQKLVPWTVDTIADLQFATDIGSDGIITNYPACMMQMQGRPMPASVTPPDIAFPEPLAACKG